MTRARGPVASWLQGPERLTVVAGALLVVVSAALLLLGWRYVVAAQANLVNAEQSAGTYVERVAEEVTWRAQLLGFGTAIETLAPALGAPEASQAVAVAMAARAERYAETCTCAPPRAQHVAILSQRTGHLYQAPGAARGPFPSPAVAALRALADTAPDNLRVIHTFPIGGTSYLLLARVFTSRSGERVAAALTYAIPEFSALAVGAAFARHVDAALASVPGRDSVLGIAVDWGDGTPLRRDGWTGSGPTGRAVMGLEPTIILTVRATLNPAMAGYVVRGGLAEPPTAIFLLAGVLLVLLAATGLVALHRARQLMTTRTLFLSGVSHELRTPLTQVLMYGEALHEGERDPARQRHASEVVVRETRRLIRMIENVLLFARGPGSGVPLNVREESLAAIVEAVLIDHGPMLVRQDMVVEPVLDDGVVARVDVGAVRHILGNLLDNAVRYGPKGQRVRVSVARAGPMAELAVDDEGPGIAMADRRRVLRPFARAAIGPSVEGTGIGLALVDQLVRAMGGRVRIETSGLGGARVVVSLPAALSPAGALP